ncbi:cobalamin-dependent protein [Candidatus Woesearchaeota archaeon]|nr:hypothetical protein [uncultured archaeon]MBS3165691.1 cobalamin-dependent protein [Candidatus Woesearchaeota archaeon]HLC86646.1 radical SAM protein [Candidatus Nanoarchaeia archaeon]
MRVLLIYPNIIETPKDISLGLSAVAAILKKDGHKVELVDTTFGKSDNEIMQQVKNFNPELVCSSMATNEFKYATHIIDIIREYNPNVPVIVGGYHPTMVPLEVLNLKNVDMVCVGEGDLPIAEVANMLEKKEERTDILNVWFKTKEGKIVSNSQRPLPNLDELPIPDRTIYDYQRYIDWHNGTATFISTRGCPYPCTYCINRTQKEIYKGKGAFVRYKSVDKMLLEIKEVVDNYKLKEVGFNDDTFTLNAVRVREFCEKYPKVVGNVPFYLNARVNCVSKEIFILLGKAGCKRVNMGVECGDPKIRNEILERDMSDEQIIQTFQWAREAGIETYAFNMIGLPYETKDSIQKTIELNKRINPDYTGCSIFTALPGTPLYDLCKKNSWLADEYSTSYFQDSNVIHPNFTVEELKKYRDSFGFEVYKYTRPVRAYMDLVDKSLIKFSSYVRLRSFLVEKGMKKIMNKRWEKKRKSIDFDKRLESINVA